MDTMDGMDRMDRDAYERGRRDAEALNGELEGLLRVAARDGIVAGLRLAEPEMAWAKAAFYEGTGEVGRLVEEIVGAVLGAGETAHHGGTEARRTEPAGTPARPGQDGGA